MSKRLHQTWLWLAVCAGATLRCGAPPASATPAETPPAATAQPAPASPAHTVEAPTADTPTQPTEPELGPSPLKIAGEHDAPFTLFGLGDVGFLHVGDSVLEVRDDRVAYDRAPNRGLPSGEIYEDAVIAGTWPDTAFVVATRTDRNRRRSELFFWDGNRWKSKFQTQKSTVIRTLAPWNLRRVLALLQNIDDGTPSFKVVAGFPIDPVPRPSSSDEEGCKTKVILQKAAILRSGHVFAAGPVCGAKSKAAAVERWEPGNKQGEISPLPDSAGVDISSIVATDASHVVVAGSSQQPQRPAYLAVFDGTAWKTQDSLMRSGVVRLVADAGGTLWAVTQRGALWKQPTGGAWEQVPMPPVASQGARIEAVSVWPRDAEDVWVVGRYQAADGKPRTVLLHTRPHEGPVPFEGK